MCPLEVYRRYKWDMQQWMKRQEAAILHSGVIAQ